MKRFANPGTNSDIRFDGFNNRGTISP